MMTRSSNQANGGTGFLLNAQILEDFEAILVAAANGKE